MFVQQDDLRQCLNRLADSNPYPFLYYYQINSFYCYSVSADDRGHTAGETNAATGRNSVRQ